MIAQGEFTKLIYSGSDEREKVLRNLFKTDDLVYLEEKLKEQVKIYRNKYDLLFNQRDMLKGSLEIDIQDLDYSEYLKMYKKKLADNELIYQAKFNEYNQINHELNVISLNNQRIKHLDKLQLKLDNYLNNQEYYQKLKENLLLLRKAMNLQAVYQETIQSENKVNKLLTAADDSQKLLINAKKELNDKEKKYLDAAKYKEKKAELSIGLQKNKELKQIFKEYQNDLAVQTSLNKQIRIIKSRLVGLEDKQNKYQKLIDKDSISISKLDKLKSDYELVNHEYKKLHQHKLELHRLSEDYDKLLLTEDQGYDLKDEYQKIEDIYLKEKQKYDLVEHRFRLSQAGILASELKENQPCPVCGSLHHPNIAGFDNDIVYHDDLKQAKHNFDKCSERRNDLYNALMLKQQKISLLKNKL